MTINWTLVTDISLKETAKGWENTGVAGAVSGETKLLLEDKSTKLLNKRTTDYACTLSKIARLKLSRVSTLL